MTVTPSSTNFDRQRLQQLTLGKCNGTLTDDEAGELSDLLAESAEARDEYWEFIAVHSELEWELQVESSSKNVLAKQLAEYPDDPKPTLGFLRSGRATQWLLALAACLAVVWSLDSTIWTEHANEPDSGHFARRTNQQVRDLTIVGNLTSIVPNSQWSFGRPGGKNATEFRQGDTIRLDEGAVELRLITDTVAMLEAPTIMQVVSADRVRVIDGGVKVEVAKGAEGFSVETSSAEVIDLGTVFSVNVADGNTDLVVFDGEVDLKLPRRSEVTEHSEDFVKRFRAGEAVQVLDDGTLSRIVNVRQSRPRSGDAESSATSVIDSVKDNNIREDFWSFYEIVPGGMEEDAGAFVDRVHQWNGAKSEGMPAYLLGGDYVKTFNDDKVFDQLRIDVTLNRPATLYVLLDTRVSPPTWLLELFEDTSDTIGVDEAAYYPEDPTRVEKTDLRVGPGQGINRTHSIWKLVVKEPGVISLGANGLLHGENIEGVKSQANMYGIVAVPLKEF